MLDAKLLAAAIASRSAWERVTPHVSAEDMLPHVGFVWKIVGEWYSRDRAAQSVDRELLSEQVSKRVTNPKHTDAIVGVLRDLPASISPDNAVQAALELRRHNIGLELSQAILAQDSKKVPKLLQQFESLLSASSFKTGAEVEYAPEWENLDELVGAQRRIPLAPRKLNERVAGGALPGHHILVYARPEIGKSTFAINMTAGFIFTGQRVLYGGTEDGIAILKARARNRFSNMTPDEVEKDPAKANRLAREFEEKHGGHLTMVHINNGTMDVLEREIEKDEPTVLVLDQIRSINSGADGMTANLEASGIKLRQLLSAYSLVGVSITQAGASAENKVWLTQNDVDSSKTGLTGTTDLQIGLGANQDMLLRDQRAVAITKNKISSQDNAKEGFIVEIDKKRSIYR